VRYSPWYAYPKVVTPELQPADCSANGKGSSWNSSMLDDIIADFMLAVCGPRAADGACDGGLSVVPQLSTIPDWMYESDGTNRSALMPSDPWVYPSGNFEYYVVQGKPLVDPTCEVMAKYAARYVGWYTAGGFVDECGIEHKSNLHYDWFGLSVLNEDEYHTPPGDGVQYTMCWDAWKREIRKVNPSIQLVGPETAGGPYGTRRRRAAAATVAQASRRSGGGRGNASVASEQPRPARPLAQPRVSTAERLEQLGGQLSYSLFFLNGSNHDDGQPPPFVSNHVALYGPPWDAFFTGTDEWLTHVVAPLEQSRQAMAPDAQLVMNEFIPFNNEWCNASAGGSCDWASNASRTTTINRQTLGWSAAAASFAYAFGVLSEAGFAWVGADQLIGGTWPDNEPAVASLDWRTGEPNAKYWAIRMLAKRLGDTPRQLHTATLGGGPAPPKPGTTAAGTCGYTNYEDDCDTARMGAFNTTSEGIGSLAQCVARCNKCAACHYVSLSLQNEDCSWYTECDLEHLIHFGANYTSEAVSPTADPASKLYALGMAVTAQSAVAPHAPAPHDSALPHGQQAASADRVLLLVSKSEAPLVVQIDGGAHATAQLLEGVGLEPGFNPPRLTRADETGQVALGPYAVAIVELRRRAWVEVTS